MSLAAMGAAFAAVLVALAVVVRSWLVPAFVIPRYGILPEANWLARRGVAIPPEAVRGDLERLPLSDKTGGRDLAPLFEAMPAMARGSDLLVAFVGDSTVGGVAPSRNVPRIVQLELAARMPDRRVQLFDLSVIGLYAQDALFVIAKVFGVEPDLVIYPLTPRIVPVAPFTRWATNAADVALSPDVVGRLGLSPVLSLLDAEELARAGVHSWWAPARLRLVAAAWIRERLHARATPLAAALGDLFLVAPAPLPPPPASMNLVVWRPEDYAPEPPTRSSRALDWIFALCAREGGRCLPYLGPLNPATTDRFPPRMVEVFSHWAADRAAAHGLPLVDHRTALPAERFRQGFFGPDPIHPDDDGWRDLGRIVAADAERRLIELGR